jgi:5-methylcytosine-specific restriction endonuclease McrA
MAASSLDRLYKSPRWQRTRALFLRANPVCSVCTLMGRVSAATVCDHDPPHNGNEAAFWDSSRFRALCPRCHGQVRADQKRGYSTMIGLDGNPIDKRHPFYD